MHIFPEGRINFNGKLGPFRWGVGKLICDSKKGNGGHDPVVLPLYHAGMSDVMPMLSRVPRVGKRIHVEVGEPVDLSDITCKCNDAKYDQKAVWLEIVAKMHKHLKALEAQSPKQNTDQLQGRPEPPELVRERSENKQLQQKLFVEEQRQQQQRRQQHQQED